MSEDVKYQKGKIIEGHDFDGIHELDNPPPPWLMYIFYLSVLFSIGYFIYYHMTDAGASQIDELEQEMAAVAKVEAKRIADAPPAATTASTNPDDIAAGMALYTGKACFACHGMNGEGNAIGPNLTDNAWINGCDFTDVIKVIRNGVPAKGMTPYKDQLNQQQTEQISSYILSLVGTNPVNAKEAQGVICE
ncbi:MAG: c-type cytochrome [Bacteroidales bacterium]|nr:c-type cytochrome [Bacteroidales bacterium]